MASYEMDNFIVFVIFSVSCTEILSFETVFWMFKRNDEKRKEKSFLCPYFFSTAISVGMIMHQLYYCTSMNRQKQTGEKKSL